MSGRERDGKSLGHDPGLTQTRVPIGNSPNVLCVAQSSTVPAHSSSSKKKKNHKHVELFEECLIWLFSNTLLAFYHCLNPFWHTRQKGTSDELSVNPTDSTPVVWRLACMVTLTVMFPDTWLLHDLTSICNVTPGKWVHHNSETQRALRTWGQKYWLCPKLWHWLVAGGHL